jgi:hypothetical protein
MRSRKRYQVSLARSYGKPTDFELAVGETRRSEVIDQRCPVIGRVADLPWVVRFTAGRANDLAEASCFEVATRSITEW